MPPAASPDPSKPGRITSAVPFCKCSCSFSAHLLVHHIGYKDFDGRKFLAAGCSAGIFVTVAGRDGAYLFYFLHINWRFWKAFRRALNHSDPKYIGVFQTLGDKVFNKFVVHSDQTVTTYSLELLARLALDQTSRDVLGASIEKIGGGDANIVLCKCAQVNGRALGISFKLSR
jgi:hypothetical protein